MIDYEDWTMILSDLDNIAYNKFANGEITLAEYIKYKNRDKIMEKKEAMKILKDFHDKSALFSVRTAMDTIIPELKETKESEDERIRKEIIYFLSRNTFQLGEDIDKYKSWLAWLEKQGEQKPTEWSEEDETRIKQLLGWLDTLKNYIHYDALVSLDLRRERIDKVSKLESWLKSLKQRLGQGLGHPVKT